MLVPPYPHAHEFMQTQMEKNISEKYVRSDINIISISP